jgi:chromosome segregation ATPase
VIHILSGAKAIMKQITRPDLSADFYSALESLTSGIYSFSSVAKRMELRLKETEELEARANELMKKAETRNEEIDERESKVKELELQLREREAQVEALEAAMGARMRELGEMEAKWSRTEKTIEANVGKVPSRVILNVGKHLSPYFSFTHA